MQMLSRRNGITITVVLAVLFGCAGLLTCGSVLFGLPAFFQNAQYQDFPGLMTWMLNLSSSVCASLAFIALPIVFYILLVRGRPADEPPTPQG